MQDRLGLRSRGELGTVVFFFVGEVMAKIWTIFFYRFDSDEPQHLHVIWAWTHGLVQYRDVFDNRMPLSQIMCAPILGLLGEHAEVLYGMRFLMVPLYFLSAWCIFRIGRIAFSARVGTWSVVASGAIWSYALCTTEFRPDDLWVLFWLMTVLVLLRKAMGWHGATVAGLLLGLAFAVSMKSTLMLLTICLAFVATMLLFVPAKSLLKRLPKTNIFAFIACGAVPPLLVAVFFAAKGVWPEFRDCVFEHNVGSGAWPRDAALHLVLLPDSRCARCTAALVRLESFVALSLLTSAVSISFCSLRCGITLHTRTTSRFIRWLRLSLSRRCSGGKNAATPGSQSLQALAHSLCPQQHSWSCLCYS
jgi:hypothetical protein